MAYRGAHDRARARAVRRPAQSARLLRRAGRHAGARLGDPGDRRVPAGREREPRRVVRDLEDERRASSTRRASGPRSSWARTRDEVIFGANMTTLNFTLTRTVSREWRAGDEVVATKLDHDANISPWLELAHDRGIIVHLCDVRRRGPARPRPPALARLRPHARRRVPVGLERARHRDAGRRDRRDRARGRRARVVRRGALRAARPDRPAAGRGRRAALLAVQVLRPAPGRRAARRELLRAVAPVQGAARRPDLPVRPPLRDGHARARAAVRASSPRSSTCR